MKKDKEFRIKQTNPATYYEKVERRRKAKKFAKKKAPQIQQALDRQIGTRRESRELSALEGGRDSLSLLAGGDIEERESVLAEDFELSDEFLSSLQKDRTPDSKKELARAKYLARTASRLSASARRTVLG